MMCIASTKTDVGGMLADRSSKMILADAFEKSAKCFILQPFF